MNFSGDDMDDHSKDSIVINITLESLTKEKDDEEKELDDETQREKEVDSDFEMLERDIEEIRKE